MAILRYFEAALKRREDIELTTVGVFTGRKIPWSGGMLLPSHCARSPDVVLPAACKKGTPLAMAKSKLDFKPDLWIQVDAGMWLDGRLPGTQMVGIGTDPHVLNYDQQRKRADRFFCMQRVYSQPGDIYLPYAYDPIWHCPSEYKVHPRYDACLLGLHYTQRDRWVEQLRKIGMKVCYDLGPVFLAARALYLESKVGLNWSSLDDLVARVFEVTAMGLPLVTNHVTDLAEFFKPQEDVCVFHNLNEAVRLVTYLVDNEEARLEIARKGHQAVKPHTYDARVQQVLEECGLA